MPLDVGQECPTYGIIRAVQRGAPSRARNLRKKLPIAVLDLYKACAANLRACAARLFVGLVLLLNTFPPEKELFHESQM